MSFIMIYFNALTRSRVSNAPELQLLSTEETLAALAARRYDTNEINASTFFGFRFKTDLKPNTTYNINVGPSVPSLEGPLKSTTVQSASFSTYPPFGYVLTIQLCLSLANPMCCLVLTSPTDLRLTTLVLLGTFTSRIQSTWAPSKRAWSRSRLR